MKNKSLFSRLLENKKLMLIVSLLLSFIFWMVSSDSTTKTINDVELNYNTLSESAAQEFKVFNVSAEKISVTASGKRVFVDALSSDNVTATLDLFAVTEPGEYIFDRNDITISSENSSKVSFDIYKPDSISVFVDREASKTVDIVSNFTYKPDGYYVDNNLPATVTITGPKTIVDTIESAYVSGEVVSSDASDITNTYNLRLFDNIDPNSADANEIPSKYITMSYDSVDVIFRYLKIGQNVPFTITYDQSNINLASSYYTITPSTISVAGPEDLLFGDNAIESFAIDIGSLSKYKNQIYNETFSLDSVLGSNFINKSDGVETIRVQLDFSNFEIETFDVPYSRIKVSNVPEGYDYKAPATYAVTVVGASSAINDLENTSFEIEYDFEGIEPSSETPVNVPVKITINSTGLCWVYRSSDTASVLLSAVE